MVDKKSIRFPSHDALPIREKTMSLAWNDKQRCLWNYLRCAGGIPKGDNLIPIHMEDERIPGSAFDHIIDIKGNCPCRQGF